jgi:hypothetical protein
MGIEEDHVIISTRRTSVAFLSCYFQVFDENGIDFSVLPDLTDQDLEKLGVLLEHRRKLLRSIANLKGIESDAPSVQVAAATAVPRPLDLAERRQVTVMFSDLVGSTALSALCTHGPGGSA